MNKLIRYTLIFLLFISCRLQAHAQTLYVDAANGKDTAPGTQVAPLASIEQAVALAHDFSGSQPVTIKVAPGLYVLKNLVELRTKQPGNQNAYTLEAASMPDDADWQPTKMPVIESISANNSTVQFAHAVGFLVDQNNVHFNGLKFVGNANPAVKYYYPISRKDETLQGLTVSQCYFIGEKNASPIQGAIWAHGGGTHVDHSIFYGCKNALLLFKSITDFSLTHSIIVGAYEAAVWFGANDPHFQFSNNLITHCDYFWLRPANTAPNYTFQNSVMSNNTHYMGFYGPKGAVEAPETNQIEQAVKRSGTILLSEVKTNGLPADYLNPLPQSAGSDLKAGIFKTQKP